MWALQLTEERFDVLSMPSDIIPASNVSVEFVIQDRDEAARCAANLDANAINCFTDAGLPQVLEILEMSLKNEICP